ncbi:isochorismatase family protein [Gordonia sp. TBRC 11910]|uniref:Isochorismatase family protein n=1 Tax=Gordonia asplenii TaxID=2725283 RepID=A0A848KT86_9ACTN|nr:isochorismatase family protein [Gordonia asplenii]NMO01906.1 isochorismatase family protein [Gordonia asplenii]
MTDPKLKPADAIVVFADLQSEIVALPLTVDAGALRRSAAGLAKLAELFDMPTVVITMPKRDGGQAQVIPEVVSVRTNYRHFQRTTPDSFDNDLIRAALAEYSRPTLIVCGVATEIVVQWLALSGRANGYQVHLVTDACAGLSTRTEAAALARLTAAGVVMTSVVGLAGELAGDMTRSPGKDAVDVIYTLLGE